MLTRILTVALAVGTLAIGTAYAQTGSSTTPSSPSTTSPSTGSGSGSSMGSGSSTTQQAQGRFDVTKFKTKAECLTAARAAKADAMLCDSVK
jgi:hypothetical protein